MVTGLSRHLREGDQINVSLTFKDQPPIQVTAVVKP
jgi:copper(I)-binding protein